MLRCSLLHRTVAYSLSDMHINLPKNTQYFRSGMQASGAHAAIAYLFALRDETRAQDLSVGKQATFM